MKAKSLKKRKVAVRLTEKSNGVISSSSFSRGKTRKQLSAQKTNLQPSSSRVSTSKRQTALRSLKRARGIMSVSSSKLKGQKAKGELRASASIAVPSVPSTQQRGATQGMIVSNDHATNGCRPALKSVKQKGHSAISSIAQASDAAASPSPISEMAKTSTVVSSSVGLSPVVSEILVQYRLRQDFVMAQGNLDRQLKRIVSRLTGIEKVTVTDIAKYLETAEHSGREHLNRLITLRDQARKTRAIYEKALTKLSQRLPVYNSFVAPLTGFGAIGLAQIIGEAGAGLEAYSKPCKLWRRFGLHVLEGRSFATWKSSGGLSAEAWTNAGYCPRRRSVIYVITDSLLKKQNIYRALYNAQKVKERAKAEALGLIVCPSADIPKDAKAGYMSLGHIKARAERWVGKRLLKDLWRAWRDQNSGVDVQDTIVPALVTTDSAAETAIPVAAISELPLQS